MFGKAKNKAENTDITEMKPKKEKTPMKYFLFFVCIVE